MDHDQADRRKQVGIQDVMRGATRSPIGKYQELVVGRTGWWRLALFEAVMLGASWVPGALGLLLRKITYPWLLGAVGRSVVFGQGVVLRHPHKIRIGNDVVIDDLVVLDAKGTDNAGIVIGDGVFLGRGTILSCKNGDIELGDHVNIGFHSEIFSGSSVRVGPHGLFAAYTYLVGGGHDFTDVEVPIVEQERVSRGITLGENVWLGAGVTVLDGVGLGSNVVVGAGAVVTQSLPDAAIAAGVPARVLRRRGEDAS
jgi:acetyltransferase-like isoleucine patch superfamily enzyme